jgi:hypothetical protein
LVIIHQGGFFMSLVRVASLLLLAVPAAASAQSMNADTFYQKGLALKKKGPLAIFSGYLTPLLSVGQAGGKAAGLARRAAVKAGSKPRYCPPAEVKGMASTEFFDRLARIPQPVRRQIDMTEATNRILAGKYPCPA